MGFLCYVTLPRIGTVPQLRMHQIGGAGLAVTSGAATFLGVVQERARLAEVNDEADVGNVDAHSECSSAKTTLRCSWVKRSNTPSLSS